MTVTDSITVPEVRSLTAEQVKLVIDVSRTLSLTSDLDVLLMRIAESATKLLDCERSSIFLHDACAHQLWTKVALQSAEIRVPESAGIVGACFTSNQLLLVPDPYTDPRFNREPDRKSGFVTRNILAAPMFGSDHKPVGVIQAINKSGGIFAPPDMALIQLLADVAGVAIERYHLQVAAMKSAEMHREVELARRVQEAMLPKSIPHVLGIDVVGWTRPASVTGGDCYDFWKTADGRLGIFLGDASGHGLGPTIIVSQVRTLVRAMCDLEPDPGRLLARCNARVAEDLEGDRFVTALVAFVSSDGTLQYASAGHGPLLCRCAAGDCFQELDTTHMPLGAEMELNGETAPPVKLAPGGAFIAVSDGIFEARNPAGELFSMPRVIKLLTDFCGHPGLETISRLKTEVTSWQGQEVPTDDQTIVICQRTA